MSKKIPILIIFISLLFVLIGCTQRVEDYPLALKWNDIIYLGTSEKLTENDVGYRIGTIQKNVPKFPKNNGEANSYPKGTVIYEILGRSIEESIAIEQHGEYRVYNKKSY